MRTSLPLFLLLAACGAPDDSADSGDTGTPADTSSPTDTGDTSDPGETGAPDTGDTDETGAPDTGETVDPTAADGCALTPVACADAAIQDLSLQDDKQSDALVDNTRDGDDWVTTVDASAGGTMNAPMNPWVYLRFTADGLVRVDIDDVSALESGAWDIAAKRYGIRVNSGDSGGSCVAVAELTGAYADVSAPPAADAFAAEDFYTDACALVEDGSGLPGNPDYRMKKWWGYNGCVTTSSIPYVVRLADDRTLKLVVEAYYQEGQEACNTGGAMGTGSAIMTWRWSFLP